MAPTPQESNMSDEGIPKKPCSRPSPGEEIVISGMSGIFPKSESTTEFMENLYNKVDMVEKQRRWVFNHPEVSDYLGIVTGMNRFDAQFFRVHAKQATVMEPMSRKLLEHAYGAIYDSGINPLQLRGKKIGVFIGTTTSESEKIVIYENIQKNGFGITGCNRAMYANRISYWIDGKGPSYSLDLACASSTACIEHAYRSISTGQCDAALVGGCNLCMHPCVSLNMNRAGFLCLDGKTKVFDKNGDGYVRSDAMTMLFLQKAKDAKRIYSEVFYAKATYSSNPDSEFRPVRVTSDIQQFLEEFYSEINVSPNEVEYIETNGAATAEADGHELDAIGKVFGKNRLIKVGSVKSNMGHSEPASGACAITKICLAYHKGFLPANLHYNEPQNHIPAVRDGTVQVLQDNVPFNRGFSALNSFSYSGANIHVLLKGHYKPKDHKRYKTSLPRLVIISGRKEESVINIINKLNAEPIDVEQIALLQNIHKYEIPGHMCRGFTIVESNEINKTVSLSHSVKYYDGTTKPIWFVYSGMGSQWATMGADLMRIPIFASAIHRCHKVLEPKGINIMKILTNPDKKIYNNILNSFVGIAAVQIGLTDILKALEIVPDNIIGHSVGELGCAYADGCFTAEEMILSAYSRGLVSIQTPFIRGSMAAIGLGYENIIDLCPPEIEVACHNSLESSTISGPADIMKRFVDELTAKGIFAKEVPCSNIAYHSKYIAEAGPGLLKYLREVIKNPKQRSNKWVSTSVPRNKWDQPIAKYSSAEYHTNNLLNPVLFQETASIIPENALVIEVAPHGLLQAILTRSHQTCSHIPLTRRGHKNPTLFLLDSIGRLYQEGLTPRVDALYPKINFPVSTETRFLSQLVEWEHSEDWPQAIYNSNKRVTSSARHFVLSIHDEEYKYLKGYVRDGITIFPESALLILVWETFSMYKNTSYKVMSVTFSNIVFHNVAQIETEEPCRLDVMILKGNNTFEVSRRGITIMTGEIYELKVNAQKKLNDIEDTEALLKSEDIYQIMRSRGHSYTRDFQSIVSTNRSRDFAKVEWKNDWLVFLESLVQLNMFGKDADSVLVLKSIRKLSISISNHNILMIPSLKNSNQILEVQVDKTMEITRCGGVEICNMILIEKKPAKAEPDCLETKMFIPHSLSGQVEVDTALLINLQIIENNFTKPVIKIVEIIDESQSVSNIFEKITQFTPSIMIEVETYNSISTAFTSIERISNADVFLTENLFENDIKIKNLNNILSNDKFVLTFENESFDTTKHSHFNIISVMEVNKNRLVLMNKKPDIGNDNIIYLPITQDNKLSWIPRLKIELQKSRRIVLVSENQTYCGLLGIMKLLNKKYSKKIHLIVIDQIDAPAFTPEDKFYKDQIEKNLMVNIFKKNQWGGLYYLPNRKIVNAQNFKLSSNIPGDIDSLGWDEIPSVPKSYTTVNVCYAGPTYRDALFAFDETKTDEQVYGYDFSGFNNRGERVMGLVAGGAIASVVEADPDLLWPVPEHWSLEDAATVILPYVHAYYCLASRFSLLSGKSVFVTGGAGAFGQAAISLCLSVGSTVYTAVSNIRKKQMLLKLFPEIDEKNITFSGDDNLHTNVLANTKGNGCSYVISCVTGEVRKAAQLCVGFDGVFYDISDIDKHENKPFGMYFCTRSKTYVSINLTTLFDTEHVQERKYIQAVISDGIAKGIVRPITRIIHKPNNIVKAFKLLNSRCLPGRPLIEIKHNFSMKSGLNIQPRIDYSSTGAYVVICGQNNLGLELVDHLINKGATKLVVNMRKYLESGYLKTKLSSWTKQGATVIISPQSLQEELDCNKILLEAKKLGQIRGIFIVNDAKQLPNDDLETKKFESTVNDAALVVANLDLVSRNICLDLRYFVAITQGSNTLADEYTTAIIHKICRDRIDVNLPALAFHIMLTDEFGIDENVFSQIEPQTFRNIFSSLDSSVRLTLSDVVSFKPKQRSKLNGLQKIYKILGINKHENVPKGATLKDLGLNDININEINNILKKSNISCTLIENLTVEQINEAVTNTKQSNKSSNGFQTFYTFIDQDETQAAEVMVPMATRLSNASEKEEEIGSDESYLLLIPGFEGHHQIFTNVCERLKIRAMSLQLGPELTFENIQETASKLMEFIRKRFNLKTKFYLLGYSYGVNIALEIASLIEKEGHTGIVFCLDSSPDALNSQLDAYIGNLSETELQNTITEHMYQIMSGKHSNKLLEDLKRTENWSDKIQACINRLKGLVCYSQQYQRYLLQSAYNRIMFTKSYKPEFKLRSEIVLMKGIPNPNQSKLPDDYNLSKYTNQPVKVFNLDSKHALTPYDSRVSSIVNSFLEPKLLQEFTEMSLCETYSYRSGRLF